MSDYDLSLTGAQIDAALSKVHNADSIPTNGSQNMITSDGVHDSLSGYVLSLNVVTNLNSPDNTTIPTTEATKSYVDANSRSLATGWTDIAATGTAATDGFIVAYVPGDSDDDANIQVTVGGYTVRSGPLSGGSELNNASVTMPIAEGETWTISGSGSGSVVRKFKAFS